MIEESSLERVRKVSSPVCGGLCGVCLLLLLSISVLVCHSTTREHTGMLLGGLLFAFLAGRICLSMYKIALWFYACVSKLRNRSLCLNFCGGAIVWKINQSQSNHAKSNRMAAFSLADTVHVGLPLGLSQAICLSRHCVGPHCCFLLISPACTTDFLHCPQTEETASHVLRDGLSAKQSVCTILNNKHADGHVFRQMVALKPVLDEQGNLVYVIGKCSCMCALMCLGPASLVRLSCVHCFPSLFTCAFRETTLTSYSHPPTFLYSPSRPLLLLLSAPLLPHPSTARPQALTLILYTGIHFDVSKDTNVNFKKELIKDLLAAIPDHILFEVEEPLSPKMSGKSNPSGKTI